MCQMHKIEQYAYMYNYIHVYVVDINSRLNHLQFIRFINFYNFHINKTLKKVRLRFLSYYDYTKG